MPFVTRKKDKIIVGRKADWGKPSGRVLHIDVREHHALYVIEQEPSLVSIRMSYSRSFPHREWSHDIWMPWRYYVIKVYENCRVMGKEAGYLFFADGKINSISELHKLRIAVFPNVFGNGGICLGYTSHFWDKTPVRAAWKAIRALYEIPGNYWAVDYSVIPRNFPSCLDTMGHETHYLGYDRSGNDFSCRWASASREQVEKFEWRHAEYSSLESVLGASFRYNTTETLTDAQVERVFEVQRIQQGGNHGNDAQ